MRSLFIHCPVCGESNSSRGPRKADVLHMKKGGVLDTVMNPIFSRYVGFRKCRNGCKRWFIIVYAYSSFSFFHSAYHPEATNRGSHDNEVFFFVLNVLEDKKIELPKELRELQIGEGEKK